MLPSSHPSLTFSERQRVRKLARIRIVTALFIVGLALSGLTAIPLVTEVDWLVKASHATELVSQGEPAGRPQWAVWLLTVDSALRDTQHGYPFLFYGTDWLAFGHLVIALAFVGALHDPVRNSWLFTFGMIACLAVPPYAFIFGSLRGIPMWWRLIDCSFGVFGLIPLVLCKRWTIQLESLGAWPKEGCDASPEPVRADT